MNVLGRPKKIKNRDTKQAIIDAAIDLFAEKGFPDTSIRLIAKTVGVTEAAIYSHFSNKQAILDTLYDLYGPKRVANIFSAMDKKNLLSDPKNYLTEKLMEVFSSSQNDSREIKLFKIHQTELFRANGKPNEMIKDQRCQVEQAISSVLKMLIDEKIIKVQYKNIRILVLQLLAPMFLIRFDQFSAHHITGLESHKLIKNHLDIFLDLILAPRSE